MENISKILSALDSLATKIPQSPTLTALAYAVVGVAAMGLVYFFVRMVLTFLEKRRNDQVLEKNTKALTENNTILRDIKQWMETHS